MEKINRKKPKSASRPLVSVIISTRNEEDVLEVLLKSIEEQSYKNVEIIVVDNFSTDKTTKIAKRFTDKVYKKGPERSVQRNYGAEKSEGEYVLILDADMQLSKDVIKECVEAVTQKKKIATVIVPEESIASNYWEAVKAFERSFYNLEGDKYTDAARFFDRKVFQEVGGYDENITGPEDWDLPERIKKNGYQGARVKSIIYHFERIDGIFSVAKKKYYYALRSNVYLKKHNISPVSPKTVYFLRPVFYKNYKHIISHPGLSFGMFIMLSLELVFGAIGYFLGKLLFSS
ncbi:glycosyltransferase [Patescibacteria group bacterium]